MNKVAEELDTAAWLPEPDCEPDCWGFNSYEHYKGACHHHEREADYLIRHKGQLLPALITEIRIDGETVIDLRPGPRAA